MADPVIERDIIKFLASWHCINFETNACFKTMCAVCTLYVTRLNDRIVSVSK